jgi:hypothetical protein
MMGSEKKRARDRERMKRIRSETADRIRTLEKFLEMEGNYNDALNALCERHGCPPGSIRLDWLEEQLSLSKKIRSAVGIWDGQSSDATATTAAEIRARLEGVKWL